MVRISLKAVYAHAMARRNASQLIVVTTFAVLGLVACGSGEEGASSEAVDREASLGPLATEVCVSREANAGPMSITFRNSAKSQGNGPFNLDYVQCGETRKSATPEVLRLDIADASGTQVLYIGAVNPELGYPKMTVTSVAGNISDTQTFSSGETHTYNVGPYSVRVERQPDTQTAKSLRVWVERP